MNDFFEIDFLDVEAKKSGDAITIRYYKDNIQSIHVIDGGFRGPEDGKGTGDKIIQHIQQYYGNINKIDRIVVTHPDGDHAGGLRKVLEHFEVGELWMLRPWEYSQELIERFKRLRSIERLSERLKEIYPNIAALEEIANRKKIPIKEPFQGQKIGEFTVLAPTKERYLDLIEKSEKTPESKSISESTESFSLFSLIQKFIKVSWGDEKLSDQPTSAENEMSIVQYAELNNTKIMLTGDAGREALGEAKNYLTYDLKVPLPGINYFQVPHHGSRRNVSSELLNDICGNKLSFQEKGTKKFMAVISSAKEDKDHPRKAVIRALIHRGANVITTEGKSICCFSMTAPKREGWIPTTPEPYPEEQED